MRTALALSGESPGRDLLAEFDHIGLIRGEYLFRDHGLYPTAEHARPVLREYLDRLCREAAGAAVWFRTLEVTTIEANTLRGVEERILDEDMPMLGLRGVRRAMRYPASLDAELAVIAEVRRTHPNLGVVAPFVAEATEFAWFAERARRHLGRDAPLASMVETPAAVFELDAILTAGAAHVIVGTNDLSSLLLGRARVLGTATVTSPALESALTRVREVTARHGRTMTVAGYLTPPLMTATAAIGADFAAVHYSDLPRLFAPRFADLPEADRVSRIKQKTRAAIRALTETTDR